MRVPLYHRCLLLVVALFCLGAVSPQAFAQSLKVQSVFSLLDGKKQDEVLKDFMSELLAVRDWQAGKAESASKGKKTLFELLKDQEKKLKESHDWVQGGFLTRSAIKDLEPIYGKKLGAGMRHRYRVQKPLRTRFMDNNFKTYAENTAKYLIQNQGQLGTLAGEISGGSYHNALGAVATAFAGSLSKIVEDLLDEMGYAETKGAWGFLAKRSGTLKKAAIEIARGNYTGFFDVVDETIQAESKALLKQYAKQGMDWVFGDVINPQLKSIEDKLPLVEAPTVGDLYIRLVEAEIAFIEWGQRALRTRVSGECLETYRKTYDSLTPADRKRSGIITPYDAYTAEKAYEEFDICQARIGRSYAFHEIEAYITQSGKPRNPIYIALLEAYRKYRMMPDDWLKQRIAQPKQASKLTVEVGLQDAAKLFSALNDSVMTAMRQRINELSWAAMSKSDQEEREKKLSDALAKARALFETFKRRGEGIQGICGAYAAARGEAEGALGKFGSLRSTARQLELSPELDGRCSAVPRGNDKLGEIVAAARQAGSKHASFMDAMNAAAKQACESYENIKTAKTQAAAREYLDKTQDAARAAKSAIENAAPLPKEVAALRDQASRAGPDEGVKDREAIRGQLEKMQSQFAALQSAYDPLRTSFKKAQDSMRGSVARVDRLATSGIIKQQAQEIDDLLKPFQGWPATIKGVEEANRIVRETGKIAADAEQCVYSVKQSWSKGDGQSGGVAWSSLEMTLVPPLDVLAQKVERNRRACAKVLEAPAAGNGADDIEAIEKTMAANDGMIKIAQKGYEGCLARAIVAYNDYWLKKRTVPPLSGLSKDAAVAKLEGLKLSWAIDAGDPAGTGAAENTVQSHAPGAGAELRRGEVVRLRIFQKPQQSDPDTVADAAIAAIKVCDFAKAKTVRGELADGGAAAGRVDAWLARARQSAATYKEGKALYAGGDYDAALGKIRAARQDAVCDTMRTQIDAALQKILDRQKEAGADQGRLDRVAGAIKACDFDAAKTLIAAFPEDSPLKGKAQSMLDRERQDFAAYKTGKLLYKNGRYRAALTKVTPARRTVQCSQAASAMDALIAAANGKIEAAATEPPTAEAPPPPLRCGSGYKAVSGRCVPILTNRSPVPGGTGGGSGGGSQGMSAACQALVNELTAIGRDQQQLAAQMRSVRDEDTARAMQSRLKSNTDRVFSLQRQLSDMRCARQAGVSSECEQISNEMMSLSQQMTQMAYSGANNPAAMGRLRSVQQRLYALQSQSKQKGCQNQGR